MLEINLMNKSDLWRKEIESLTDENSVRILSTVLGVSRGEAADKMLEVESVNVAATGFRQILAIGQILGHEVHTASKIQSHRTGIRSGVEFTDKFPKVNTWMERNPGRMAVLRAKCHFFYIGYGIVLDKTGREIGHLRVTHVVFLDEED